jgi:hypothetical protein
VSKHDHKLFVGVDEYDAPANACLLSLDDRQKSNFLPIKDLFYAHFFSIMKGAMGRPVYKYWITGVLPAFRDSLSPLSTAIIISSLPQYHALCGFTVEEVETIASAYLRPRDNDNGLEGLMCQMKKWYNGYMFCPQSSTIPRLFNPQLVFTHLRAMSPDANYVDPGTEPNSSPSSVVLNILTQSGMTDENLYSLLSGALSVTISHDFGHQEIERLGQDPGITWSLLYYVGLITHDGGSRMRISKAAMRSLVSIIFLFDTLADRYT